VSVSIAGNASVAGEASASISGSARTNKFRGLPSLADELGSDVAGIGFS
jgi:hypothetical protein